MSYPSMTKTPKCESIHTNNQDVFYSLEFALDIIRAHFSTVQILTTVAKKERLQEEFLRNASSYWDAVIFFIEEVQEQCNQTINLLGKLKNQKA